MSHRISSSFSPTVAYRRLARCGPWAPVLADISERGEAIRPYAASLARNTLVGIGVALRGGQVGGRPVQADTLALLRRFAAEHDHLHEVLPLLRTAADLLAVQADRSAVEMLRRACAALAERLVPHEEAEEAELLPAFRARSAAARRLPR